MKIAIQGGKSSFHHIAARSYFGDESLELVECATFRQLCRTLEKGMADMGVMAIENSLVGGILPNYALLSEYALQILEETYLHIDQNLMALPGQSLWDIRKVYSHPMALLQCSAYLEDHPEMLTLETWDTADSAREIRDQKRMGVAAIAGRKAAEAYGLEILAGDIHNGKENYTRFLILAPGSRKVEHPSDKASINFKLKHKAGSLADALDLLRRNAFNLTQIQSLPIPNQLDEYSFHVDLEWNGNNNDTELFYETMEQLKRVTLNVQILGVYKKGARVHDHTSLTPA